MAIFDTNIMIDYLSGSKKAESFILKYGEAEAIGITSITAYELVKGISDIDEELLVKLFERVRIFDVTLSVAWTAGKLHRSLKASGKTLGEADLLIAATAFANDETLVTQDKDFKRLGTKQVVVI